MESESLPELKDSLTVIKAEINQRQQEVAQQQQEQSKLESQLQRELIEDQQAHEIELKKIEGHFDLEKAKIDVFKFQQDLDSDNNGIPDPLEVTKLEHNMEMDKKKLVLEEKKIDIQKEKAKNSGK